MSRFAHLTAAILAALACGDSAGPSTATRTFTVQVSGETFNVRVASDAQAVALRARMASGRVGVISGQLAAGDGGFNAPWSWHLVPSSVTAPDLAIELCDGRPSFVQNDLTYWMQSVKQFCPWGARVVSEN